MLRARVVFFLPLMNRRLRRVAQKMNFFAPVDNGYERQMDVSLPWLHVRFASHLFISSSSHIVLSLFCLTYTVRLYCHADKIELTPL
jgi:hypothetical protein